MLLKFYTRSLTKSTGYYFSFGIQEHKHVSRYVGLYDVNLYIVGKINNKTQPRISYRKLRACILVFCFYPNECIRTYCYATTRNGWFLLLDYKYNVDSHLM